MRQPMARTHLTERLFSLHFCYNSQQNGRSLAQGVLWALFNGVSPLGRELGSQSVLR